MKLNKNGFTLVELLAVIVVLALLMVVATRSIGGALGDAKASAMESEGAKFVSKTYEDIQSYILYPDKYNKFTYGGNITATTYAGGAVIDLEEGDYTAKVKLDANKVMTKICIDDGTNKKVASIKNGNTIDSWPTSSTSGTCANTDVNS